MGWRVERVITDIGDNEARIFLELKTLVKVGHTLKEPVCSFFMAKTRIFGLVI